MKSLAVLAVLVAAVTASAIPERGQRVIGGDVATSGQFPYSVGLITRINILLTGQCSGALISANYILTSAGCLSGIESAVAVIGGLRIQDTTEAGQVRMTVTDFIIHSGYDEADEEFFDVALIRLPSAIQFNDHIRAVRLPNRRQVDSTFNGQRGTFIGWGRFGQGTTNSPDLRFGHSQVISTLACRLSLPTNTILDEHVCTSGTDHAAGTGSPCQGDSGAPLTITEPDGVTTLIGVFSFHSILGCDSGRAAVFTRLSAYLNWIETNSDVVIRDDF